MGINEDLRSFINKYRVEKGVKIFTNTSIGLPKVSLNIPDENYDDFLNLYGLAMTNGVPLYFTEKSGTWNEYFSYILKMFDSILDTIVLIITKRMSKYLDILFV